MEETMAIHDGEDGEPVIDATTGEEVDAMHALAEAEALTRVRELLLGSDPGIDPALVGGDTVAELEASFNAAKAVAERARREASRMFAAGGGAPGRFRAEPATALEKIKAGLGQR